MEPGTHRTMEGQWWYQFLTSLRVVITSRWLSGRVVPQRSPNALHGRPNWDSDQGL